MGKTPRGVFSRSMSLLSMASKVAAKELKDRVSDTLTEKLADSKLKTRIEQAKILVDHLAHLKGAAMKAGQLLSLDSSDFLPPEAIEVLAKLQAEAKPADTQVLKRVLLTELGKERYSHIRNFSDSPLAAASIGQVHRAQLDGQDVAIKIQYPGVADSIDSDLAILRTIAQSFLKVSGKKFSLEETFNEVRDVLKRETDYNLERENLETYRRALAGNPNYILPQTFTKYCTDRVLTMSYEHGTPLAAWITTNHSRADREQVARQVLELFCAEFVDSGLVQTDPNFGNFLVRGSPPQLVLLDFGATLSYSAEFRHGYARLLRDLTSQDVDRIFNSARDFGLLDAREGRDARVAFKEMITVSLEPFNPDKQPFRFTDPSFEKRTRQANLNFSKALVYSPPPKKLLFLHRKLGGIFNLAKRLDVTLDLRPYWAQMTKAADNPAAP